MKIIGITGGIGSGKSTVCRLFAQRGIAVYEADVRAKAVIEENEALISGIKQAFGTEAYFLDGSYNRKYMADIVFHDAEKLAELNALVHPAVRQDFVDWQAHIAKDYPHDFVLKEAAILYETGTNKDTDAVIAVYAPKSIRIQRVMSRDAILLSEVLLRMQRQWADSRKLQQADFVIYNDGKHDLPPQVAAVLP